MIFVLHNHIQIPGKIKFNCSYSIVGDIIIKVSALSSSTPLHFVFKNILNPLSDSSSYFGLEIRSGTHLLESDRQFRMLTFTPDFASSTNGMIF